MPIYHWPGYVVPWRSYYELAADNLGKVGITVELKPEEYGKYISTTALGKYEKAAMGPSTPFTEVDEFLFGRFYPELPTNQSHVADAELTEMLVAQRREMDGRSASRSSTTSSATSSTRRTTSTFRSGRSTSPIPPT